MLIYASHAVYCGLLCALLASYEHAPPDHEDVAAVLWFLRVFTAMNVAHLCVTVVAFDLLGGAAAGGVARFVINRIKRIKDHIPSMLRSSCSQKPAPSLAMKWRIPSPRASSAPRNMLRCQYMVIT